MGEFLPKDLVIGDTPEASNRHIEKNKAAGYDFTGMSDDESAEFQLKHWVDGISLHNTVRGECCPDFSCCNPDSLMPKEVREAFAKAHRSGDRNAKMRILGMALSGLTASVDANVHIAGESDKTVH